MRALGELTSALERGVGSPGELDGLLDGLLRFHRCAAAAITQAPDFLAPGRHLNLPGEWPALHLRCRAQDPSPGLLAGRPTGASFTTGADLTPEDREQELFIRFRGFGFGDGLVTRIYSPFSSDLYLVLYRAREAPAFTGEDRLLVQMLHPHLAGAFASTCALSHLRSAEGERALPAAERILASVALSFPGARVQWTPQAQRFFAGQLGAVSVSGWARIERLIAAAAQRFDRWQVGGRSQLLLAGIRVEFASVAAARGEERRMIAMFLAESDAAPVRLRGEELLSGRQREVAREAARGETAARIAAKLGISVETVRFHLKEAFRRLGIRRRSELVQLRAPAEPTRPPG